MKLLSYVALFSHVVSGFSTKSSADLVSSRTPSRTLVLWKNNVLKYDHRLPQRYHQQHVLFGRPAKTTTTKTTITTTASAVAALPRTTFLNTISKTRGGDGGGSNTGKSNTELMMTSTFNTGTKCPMTSTATILGSLWGTGGVLYILGKAIKRVMPIALEPFQKGSLALTQYQLVLYIFTCLWFAYVEGYKGFQCKFSPLVVKRSFTLVPGKNGTKWYHFLIAPLYSMGLVHATKKRKIVSWSVTIGVTVIVAAVKKLPYPYRNIIDAGVVTGLTWGSISIVLLYLRSWFAGTPPCGIDPELPIPK